MKAVRIVTQVIYWLIVASIPLLPIFSLRVFHSEVACSASGVCFRYGNFLLNSEGQAIVMLAALLLWPLCIGKLLGSTVGAILQWQVKIDKAGRLLKLVAGFYWFIVAFVPLLFWYLLGTSQAPSECTGARSCLDFYSPLDTSSVAVVCVVFCVLWPLCYLRLRSYFRKMQKQEGNQGHPLSE